MPIGVKEAKEIIETIFIFDNVGDAMIKVRRDPKSEEAQQELVKQLIEFSKNLTDDTSPESIEIITKAAKEQVKQYAEGSSAAKSGCGSLG
jgi:putative heme degradation protein